MFLKLDVKIYQTAVTVRDRDVLFVYRMLS